jgi:hypothetical protein
VSKPSEGLERLDGSTLFQKPSRRLGAEVDSDDEREGRDESRSELKTPGDGSDIRNDDVLLW